MDVVGRVRSAMADGARTRKEIALASGLDRDVVDAVLDVLLRTHDIEVHALKFECGAGGCGNCVQDSSCAPAPAGTPVTIPLRPRP